MGNRKLIEVEYSSSFNRSFFEDSLHIVRVQDEENGNLHRFAVKTMIHGGMQHYMELKAALEIAVEELATLLPGGDCEPDLVEKDLMERARKALVARSRLGETDKG